MAALGSLVAAGSAGSGAGSLAADEIRWFSTAEFGVGAPTGIGYDARRGYLVILDANGALGVTADQTLVGPVDPTGIDPGSALTVAANRRSVSYGATTVDVTGLGLDRLIGGVRAPSSDGTDAPTTMSLYLLDAGSTPRVVEATTMAPSSSRLGGGMASQMSAPLSPTATLVRTTDTSAYSIPSPDTSGVVWIRHQGRLMLVDSEVEEMPWLWNVNQVNMYPAAYDGTLDPVTAGKTVPWSYEPTGIAYDPISQKIFVSDDDARRVFVIGPGNDGRYGTGDDVVSSWRTIGGSWSNNDPEDVTFDVVTGDVWVIDGIDSEVYRYQPGADQVFGTADDPAPTQFDTYLGGLIRDPEGIAYYEAHDTLLVLDSRTKKVFEFNKSGVLLTTIDIAAAGSNKPAGIGLAPASNGSGGLNMYIVDRGVDNASNPLENDGKLYEMSAGLVAGPPPPNQAPVANAGPDQTLFGTYTTTLDARGSTDDGGAAGLSFQWSQISGNPSIITNPTGAVTSVTLPGNGSYTFRVTVTDSASPSLSSADDVVISVSPGGQSGTVQAQVSAGNDDAEENTAGGAVGLTSTDLDLVIDNFGTATQKSQVIGLRFGSVAIPKNATITAATIQFRADETSSGAAAAATTLTIKGQAADNPTSFTTAKFNVSTRPQTIQSVQWSPPVWTINAVTPAQQSPDLTAVVQEIVDRPGWASGNAMAFVISGTGAGTRVADSYEGNFGPVLSVSYVVGGPPANASPVVTAGPDQSITSALPATTTLAGSVSDDGLPAGGSLTQLWSQVSGPGIATFASPTEKVTAIVMPAAGPYVFRLTATDGDLSASSDVTVTVTTPVAGPMTFSTAIATGIDDSEQTISNGNIQLTSTDLDMPLDGSTPKLVGLRFTNVTIPAGALIESAVIQFRSDEVGTAGTTLTIRAQASANPTGFTTTKYDLSNRPLLTPTVSWSPPPWTVKNQVGPGQASPSLVSLVEGIVGQVGWTSGNPMVFIISGTTTGTRVADSYEGLYPPVLTITYRLP